MAAKGIFQTVSAEFVTPASKDKNAACFAGFFGKKLGQTCWLNRH